MISVLRKEISSFFNSLVGYLVIIVFLTVTGLFTWVFPQTSIAEYGFADLSPLFNLSPYVLMFLIPAITMRTFAEEKRTGTMELLLTRPLTDMQIILGKYWASLLLVIFALLPTLIYYYTVWSLGDPVGNVDSAAVAGSYAGLLLLSAVFTAFGVFASSLTENQIAAFITAVLLCYIMYEGLTSLASVNVWADYAYVLTRFGADMHYRALSKGLIDTRNVIYMLSLTTVTLFATKLVLGSRKW